MLMTYYSVTDLARLFFLLIYCVYLIICFDLSSLRCVQTSKGLVQIKLINSQL